MFYSTTLPVVEPTSLSGALDASWVDIGYTQAGHIFTSGSTTNDVIPEEEYYPVSTIVTAKTSTVAFALLQITAVNLKIAMNGGTITTTGSGASGYVTFEPPAPGTETRIGLLWQSQDWTVGGAGERWLFRKCFQTAASARNMKKAVPAADLPVSFNLEKPTGLQPWKVWLATARSGA